jgi:hypothetical protein
MGRARGSRRLTLAIAAAAIAAAASLPSSAAAGVAAPVLKVAKHKDGPYREFESLNAPVGKSKTLYWKAKSVAKVTLTGLRLSDAITSYPESLRVKWFRGRKEITDKVQDGLGYSFKLRPGESQLFKQKIKAKDDLLVCLRTAAGSVVTGYGQATAAVNDAVCGL